MIKHILADKVGIPVEINSDPGEDTGLVVATRPHKTFDTKTVFFINPTYGREMAQNGAYGDVVWMVHDGTDTTEADSGNCDGIGVDTNKLMDSLQNFTDTVVAGMTVHNTTDGTYTWVTAVDNDTTLTLLDDIMDDGEDYIISPTWTFSEPTGTKWIENNTEQFHNGTKSLKCDNPVIGDILQLLNVNGEGITLAHCTAITMWIYVDKDWAAGDSFSLYGHNAGALIGNKVYLEDYFDYDNYDTWHLISIPLADMGLTVQTLDALRIENEAREGGKSPKFWIDELRLRVSGTPIDYEVIPDKGTWFHIKSFQTTFVDAVTADNADSTMMNLSYDKILDMTPTTGYIYRRYCEGNTDPVFEVRITNLMDLLSLPYSSITNAISDGTNTLITITNEYPAGVAFVLKAEDLDKIVYTVEDDFSQLLFFRISVQGYVEHR